MTNLFQYGEFPLHSGGFSDFKIECDALIERDWQTLALMIARRASPFGDVVSVPHGGDRLSYWLDSYKTVGPILVVDDVLTTGNSIKDMMYYQRTRNDNLRNGSGAGVKGFVIFARNECPPDVQALFQMN